MTFLFTNLQPIYNDAPEPWQIGFQDGASPGFEGITELHDSIFFFLVVISVGVFWALGSVMINFNSTSSPIVYKYANHGFKHFATIFFILLLLSWHNCQLYSTESIVIITSSILPVVFNSKNSLESQKARRRRENINILAIVLHSLRISPLPPTNFVCGGLLLSLITITILYAAALLFNVVYIQSNGSGVGIFSGVFNDFLLEIFTSQLLASSLLPIAPSGNIKPKRLTNLEKLQFSLPAEKKTS